MTEFTPWAQRFVGLDDAAIAARTRSVPKPIVLPDSMPIGTAATTLRRSLEAIFVATPQCIRILRRILEVARAYSQAVFPDCDARAFTDQLYHFDELIELAPVPAICLTGLAGSGKSALLRALRRLIVDRKCEIHPGQSLPLRTFLYLAVREHDTEAAIFDSLRGSLAHWGDPVPSEHAPPSGGTARAKRLGSVSRTMPFVKRGVFRDGVAAILLDELQFLAQSGATARITKTLLLHSYLGPPLIYAANYDMVHGLASRAQQYRDRVLSSPLIVLPDCLDRAEELSGWIEYLTEVRRVAKGVLVFDPKRDAEQLHRYSFGLRRKLLQLFEIAYGHARETGKLCADRGDFEWAYKSHLYHVHRADVEALIAIALGGKSRRADLVCPFDLDQDIKMAHQRFNEARYMEEVAQQAVVASLSPVEAKAYAAAGGTVDKPGATSNRRSSGPRVREPVSARSLAEGRQRFKGGS